jgi:hypothetical protein
MQSELITRCDNCDMPIDLDKAIIVEITNNATEITDRYSVCKPCCRNNTIYDMSKNIQNKTAQA